jgi:hypothetical protein
MPRRKKDTSSSYFRTNAPPPRRRGLRGVPKWKRLVDFCPLCEKEVLFDEAVKDEDDNLVHPECIEKRDAARRRLAQSDPEDWTEDL